MTTLIDTDSVYLQRDLYPEKEVILCCARTFIDIPQIEKLKTKLNENINWNYLISLANQHGVMPLLYWNLNQFCPELVPETTLNQLKKNFYTNTSYNLTLTSELLNLLDLFKTHNISAIPFKGAVLASSVYGNLGLRQFGDLDIIVNKQDFFKVKQLLEKQGYQIRRKVQKNNTKARVYVDFQNELEFIQKERKISVDLHCHISPLRFSGYPPIKHLWNSLEITSLVGTNVNSFKPEEKLLVLCLHGSKENWSKLARICDIAALLNTRKDINLEQLIINTKKWGSRRILYVGLLLANQLLDTTIPKKILQQIKTDLVAKSITNQLCRQFFLEHYTASKSFKRFLFHLRTRESSGSKLKYCLISTIYYQIRSWLGINH